MAEWTLLISYNIFEYPFINLIRQESQYQFCLRSPPLVSSNIKKPYITRVQDQIKLRHAYTRSFEFALHITHFYQLLQS